MHGPYPAATLHTWKTLQTWQTRHQLLSSSVVDNIEEAIQLFSKNTSLIDPKNDEAMWNLNAGLIALCKGIDDWLCDPAIDVISERLDQLELKLRNLERVIRGTR